MPARRPKKISSPDTIAFRLQAIRLGERYIQAELAQAIGCTREAWATYERGRVPLPLSVGLAFCRRLDISLRWLAEGEEPKRPHISPHEMKVDCSALEAAANSSEQFVAAYRRLIAGPADRWYAENPLEDIILRELRRGPEAAMRRLSLYDLKSDILRWAANVQTEDEVDLAGWIPVLEAAVAELKNRIAEMYPHMRAVLQLGPRMAGQTSVKHNLTSSQAGDIPSSVMESSLNWENLRARLAEALKERGARSKLARALGVTRQAVGQWVNGDNSPSADFTLRLFQWVTASEAQKKDSARADTRTEQVTRSTKRKANEKRKPGRKRP